MTERSPRRITAIVLGLLLVAVPITSGAPGGVLQALAQTGGASTTRVSLTNAGQQANDASGSGRITDDGRYVVFDSTATNIVTGDNNGVSDVFLRDRTVGTTTRLSVSSSNKQGNDASRDPIISGNGRYVAFSSSASNLVSGDRNRNDDIFVRDTATGSTTRVSVSSAGEEGNFTSVGPDITPDGRYVVFSSFASNLVPNDGNSSVDLFLRDRTTNTTTRISVSSTGAQAIPGGPGSEPHERPAISDDGRYVAFGSNAINLVPSDTNGVRDIFLRDVVAGTTIRLSVSSFMEQSNDRSTSVAISGDGRFAAFWSSAMNLVPDDFNGEGDVFVREIGPGLTTLASISSSGVPGNLGGSLPVSISRDGRYVVYPSASTNLVTTDTNVGSDVFLRDTTLGTTELLSRTTAGAQASGSHSAPNVSSTGRYVVFTSSATTLVTGDTNARNDVFLRDRATPLSPSVVLDSPTAESSVFGSQPLTATMLPGFTATRVDFLVDGAVVGSDSSTPYSIDWNTTAVADGDRAIVARATLTDGGTSDSTTVVVRVINRATCDEKLEVDHQAGKIGMDEHIRSGLFCIFQARLLTGRHASTTPIDDAQAALFRVMRYWDQASTATQDEMTQFIADVDRGFYIAAAGGGSAPRKGSTAEPVSIQGTTCEDVINFQNDTIQRCTYITPDNKFRIEYPGLGSEGETPPDRIDTIEDSLRAALAKYTDASVQEYPGVGNPLGFDEPDHQVRVVLHPFPLSAGGNSVSPPPNAWPTNVDIYFHPELNPYSTPRHEFFHVIQWGYMSDGNYFSGFGSGFWAEATAEWASHQAVTPDMPVGDRDNYADDLPAFLGDPAEAILAHAGLLGFLDDREYGGFILAEYFEERFDADFIRRTFDRIRLLDAPALEAVDDVLRDQEGQPGGMADILPDFWKRSYQLINSPTGFLDPDLSAWIDILRDDGRTAADGHAGPRPRRSTFSFTGGLTQEGGAQVEPGGAAFIDFVHDVGRPVTLEIRLRNSTTFFAPPAAGSLTATLYSFSQYPSLCRAPVDMLLESGNGVASQSVGLGETCSFSTLVLSNREMTGNTNYQKFTVRMWGAPEPGDVFVGQMGGRVGVYEPDGTRVANLLTGPGGAILADGETIGVAFDDTGGFYATNFDNASVSKFAPDGTLVGPFGTGYLITPESIVFDPQDNAYVGHVEGTADVQKRAPDGSLIESLNVGIEDRGADHMALRPDGCTLVYTSEGSRVLQYDVCTRQQLPDFTTMTPRAFGIGVLPDGGIVVAAESVIRRFNAQGGQVQTYDVAGTNEWFGLGLDPDGTSFWAGDIRMSRVYHFDLATGQILHTIQTDAPTVSPEGDVGIGGIAIMPDILGGAAPVGVESSGQDAPAPLDRLEDSDLGGVRR